MEYNWNRTRLTETHNSRNYAATGLSIQQAMLDVARTGPQKSRSPRKILWGEHWVQTSDCIDIPAQGHLRLTIIAGNQKMRQGVDLKVNGGIYLADGSKVEVLRTWHDPRYEDIVEYDFVSSDGKLWVWNVYKIANASQEIKEDKWTDNAGFWIEEDGRFGRTYHCSAGPCNPPDFGFFVFAIAFL